MKTYTRLFSLLLAVAMVFTLLPATALAAAETTRPADAAAATGETITVTVTMNTQSVAEDPANYGLTPLPASAEVTIPAGSTAEAVMAQWQKDTGVAMTTENGSYGPYITVIGEFGAYGTEAFNELMAAAGLDPVPDIFQYAGWTYTLNGNFADGIGTQTVQAGDVLAFRLCLYMASGTWEQIDFTFLDAWNGLKAHIAEADALEAPSAAVTEARTAAQAVIDAIDAEAYGLWLNYFAAKQTAMTGPGSPTDQLQKADLALADALAGKVTPETITINANKPALSVGTDYQIPYTVGPEGASQEATFDILLGGDCFTVSDAGVITPTKASTMCMIQIKSKSAPSVSANFMFTITDPNQAAADAVIAQIAALPAQITLEDFEAVKAAQAAYDALTPEAKALVTNTDKLNAAVAALAALRQPAAVDAWWPSFRGSDNNMAIVDVRTPVSPETTELKWNKKLGSGWSAAPSPMIIVNDSLVVMVGSSIYRLSLEDGSVLAQGKMVASIGFGIVIPTYGNGMIFCPLGNGTVQAFDAATLESLWVYRDALGGQPNCPITYADGMVYTGFWNNETADANFVAIDVRDENPVKTNEAKEAVWTRTARGGYYWAGSVVVGDAVIFGTDDGSSGSEGTGGHLYALNRRTGEVISDLTGEIVGDQRSSIAYSAEKGRIYFTTKGGYLYSAAVDASTGALSDLKGSKLGSNQSTSTPVVYGDQVYLCCGAGVGGGNTANNFTVCSADTLEQLYVVGMKAYPQCSPLMSTAYLEREGKLYFYLTYNGKPGGITLIKVDPTKSTADGAELVELYDAKGFEQYCICSVICDENGTLYYKNDSCNILAVGSTQPDRFDLLGANVVLGDNLDMMFAIPASARADWAGCYAEIVRTYADGRPQETVRCEQADWNDQGNFIITYSGIAAKEMGDTLTVTVYGPDGTPISNTWTDSLCDYALRLFGKSKSAAQKTLLADLLNYGAEAQKHFGYHEDALVSSRMPQEMKDCASTLQPMQNKLVPGEKWLGTNLITESSIRLMLAYRDVTADMYASYSYTDHYGKSHTGRSSFEMSSGFGAMTIEGLALADARMPVTVTVYTADGTVFTETRESIESYLARQQDLSPLFDAIMKIADSAHAYLHEAK